jgi:DNA polymerase (family X)
MLKMDKEHIAQVFEDIATLLELKGENPFRIRAYLNGARALLNLDENLEKLIQENRLTEYEGIGKDLCEKIQVLAETGTHPFYEELKKSIPEGLQELMHVPGLGGKKIKALYDSLKITSIKSLKQACLEDKVAGLPRFGAKTQANILESIIHLESYSKRHLWWDAEKIARPILLHLSKLKGVKIADIAGSLRRKMETVKDLDFVVATSDPEPIMKWFTTNPAVEAVITHGPAKSSVRLKGGTQAELRIVPEKQYAFALCYSTGSKNHNIKLRRMALDAGLSLSEWGMIPLETTTPDPFAKQKKLITEGDIYKALGMEYIPPELREETGEIEAALINKLPRLIEEKDIRGTFHVHTAASDGRATLDSMVKAAEKYGWEYLGISDHSKSSFQANGLNEERLLEQVKQIRKMNQLKKYKIHLFSGVECDILPTGKLDFSNTILKELDFVIVSVHSSMNQDEKTMTNRIIKAIENPYTSIVGHVTGRILLKRDAYHLDLQKIIDACIANGKIMELNAHPQRLDMDWRYWHKAAEKGLICSINPDAHDCDWLQYMQAGVNIARKGWLEAKQVLNTYPLESVKIKLKS